MITDNIDLNNLPEFDAGSECSKCGYSASSEYTTTARAIRDYHGKIMLVMSSDPKDLHEFIVRKCRRCEYEWAENIMKVRK